MTVRSDLVRGTATLLLCVIGAWALWALHVPPPRWSELQATTGSSTTAIDAVVFALWALSTVAASYQVLAATLQLLAAACARRARTPRLQRVATRLTPRWMAIATVGAVTGTSWISPAVGAADGGELRPDVVMEVVTDEHASTTEAPRTMLPWAAPSARHPSSPDRAPSTLGTVPAPRTPPSAGAGATDAAATSTTVVSASGTATTTEAATAPRLEALVEQPTVANRPASAEQVPPPLVVELGPQSRPTAAGQHVVAPGESFWAIAEQVVADRALPVPVASYWRLLVEANRERLVDRDDPDLIHPGQELVLP